MGLHRLGVGRAAAGLLGCASKCRATVALPERNLVGRTPMECGAHAIAVALPRRPFAEHATTASKPPSRTADDPCHRPTRGSVHAETSRCESKVSPEEVRRRVAERPETTLNDAIAWAAYWALSETPPLERPAVLLAFAEEKRRALELLERLQAPAP